ncbi:MAG: LamG-like jellyroll fold domain-containing protein [Bacteroidales bacterium]
MKKRFTLLIGMFLLLTSGTIFAQKWALKFNGADENSLVDCGFNAALYPAQMTIEGWFYIDTWVGGGNYVLATENWTEATGPMGYAIRLVKDTGVEFVLGLGANNWGVISSGYGTLDSLKWTHFAATFDGVTMKVYVNGEFMLDQDVAGPMLTSDQNLILGEGATWKGRRLDGKMYDIRLWSTVRTDEQIRNGMRTQLAGTETNLVANWKMDEGTGTTLQDATGSYPASIKTGVTWYNRTSQDFPTYADWAMKFNADDENSLIDCGYNANLYPANMTLEGWFYVDKWVGGGNYVLATENWTEATGPMGYAIRLVKDTGVEFVLGLGANNWGVISSGYGTMDSLSWNHFAATFDGTTMKVYVNGQFMLDQDVAGPMLPSDQNLILGEGATWRGRRLTGNLLDIRLWSVVRTEAEISGNMNKFLVGTEPGLVANWKMNEGTGTTLSDLTGNFPASIKSGVQWLSLKALGIGEIPMAENIRMYPNPVSNLLMVDNQNNVKAFVTIMDLSGRQVFNGFIEPGKISPIDVSRFERGLYVVKVVANNQVCFNKIIVN